MYCSQCGKKLRDEMLFCPYCGTPAPAMDADDASLPPAEEDVAFERSDDMPEFGNRLVFSEKPQQHAGIPVQSEERVVSLFDLHDEPKSDVDLEKPNFDAQAETESSKSASEIIDIPEEKHPDEHQKRRESTLIQTPETAKSRAAKTFIPVQDVDPDNIFMNDEDENDTYDDYDDDYSGSFDDEDDYEFEDREEGGFFRRHIRGFVGLILFVLLATICFVWVSTPRGQTVLAKMNLAWKPQVYADLAYEAYQNDNNLLAARYYEQAYSRDSDNYTYAHSAMVAYYDADDLENATTMLKICVDLQPNNPEPYTEFLILYPDEASRPWEITELIMDGYQRTGDERLNIG